MYNVGLFQHWLTELEILAMILAAAIHDYEHTGTTNNFHIQTRSDAAILYNDRSVLENHHVSAAYRIMQEDDMNVLANLSKDDWRDLRTLVIEMVLSTDMSGHFQQIKTMRNTLQQPEGIDKSKAMSLILHAADISHPAKPWDMHQRWTDLLMEEFFRQGDKESELGLPFSPLCDRKSTLVAQSQIGFIDFIVEPTFTLLTDSTEKIVMPLIEEATKADHSVYHKSSLNNSDFGRGTDIQRKPGVRTPPADGSPTMDYSLATVDLQHFKKNLVEIIQQNKERWKELAVQGITSQFIECYFLKVHKENQKMTCRHMVPSVQGRKSSPRQPSCLTKWFQHSSGKELCCDWSEVLPKQAAYSMAVEQRESDGCSQCDLASHAVEYLEACDGALFCMKIMLFFNDTDFFLYHCLKKLSSRNWHYLIHPVAVLCQQVV
ncbi:unnamed protein product [Ranitomeya imitator]|uniref:Phosphodiesterase n=1 Tax=Ranitomeya imitator TaxID=111125 RepID=A0ABN9MKQ9_9NEOB|nr:unnamed protein product [Ranitomeya imitator]